MRVVVAPDSFKGTIGAADAAAALARGWLARRPGDEVTCLPLADGGEGTLDVLAAASGGGRGAAWTEEREATKERTSDEGRRRSEGGMERVGEVGGGRVPLAGAVRWHRARVSGPGTAPVDARWLELPGAPGLITARSVPPGQRGGVHVIEMASAAGLPLLAEPDPLRAHTAGVGELIGHALDTGAHRIVVALGGSASTDGGAGALAALGARFRDAAGRDLDRGGAALAGLAGADLTGLRPLPPGGAACLTDVRAPLLGPGGAAAVFGPQKGAGPAEVAVLEAGLARLAAVLGGQPDAPGAGAAGGTGYGLAAAWGAALLPGSEQIAQIAGLDGALDRADLVITGEGRYDATSGSGKVVGAVYAAARRAGVPAALVAGVLGGPPPEGPAVALAVLAGTAAAAMAEPARWLAAAGSDLAGDLGG